MATNWEFPYELENTCSYSVNVHFQGISGHGVYSSITGMVNWDAAPPFGEAAGAHSNPEKCIALVY